jgi:ABC-type taurine transport system substrate-binding protein
MTSSSNPAYQGVAPWIKDESQHRRDMARTINAQLIGKLNVTLDVTLNASAASTTITDARIGYTTAIIPAMAMTADGAAAIAAGIWVDTLKSGSCVVHHASNAAADQKIRFVFIG